MADPGLVFVYGLLMRGLELHHHMDSGTFVGCGRVDGRIVSLGRFPGLVSGKGAVRGELYRFDDLPAALDVLDEIEEYDPIDPERSVYVRVATTVRTDEGAEVAAWVYRYDRPIGDAPTIPSGDWRARASTG